MTSVGGGDFSSPVTVSKSDPPVTAIAVTASIFKFVFRSVHSVQEGWRRQPWTMRASVPS